MSLKQNEDAKSSPDCLTCCYFNLEWPLPTVSDVWAAINYVKANGFSDN